jgi:hypothetical protein
VNLHSQRFFEQLRVGNIVLDKPTVLPFSEARIAHDKIESRQSIGSIVLAVT